jgi:protein-S-isoprenylcysteine O-methyltransferase Ste14
MISETLVRIVFAAIFFSVVAFGSYHRYRSNLQPDRFNRIKNEGPVTFAILRMCGAALWGFCFLFPFAPSLFSSLHLELPLWVHWAGLIMALFAVPMGVSVFRNIGRNITDTVETRAHHELVTTGIYRYIRHPLYTTGFLLFFGLGLFSALWPVLLLSLVVLITLSVRTVKEEERLIAEFGDRYRTYMANTGKFIPKFF